LAALGQQHWAPNVNVIVKDGIVELRGAITDERERQALVVLTENVAGVKQIHDHLVWVEPMSGVALLSAEDEAKEEEAKEKEVRPSIAVADRMKSARPEGWQETLP
jgi:hypothetical protein